MDGEGFFTPLAHPGERVDSGDVIGRVEDKKDIVTPYGGILISLSAMRYVFEGDVIAQVAPPLVGRSIGSDTPSRDTAVHRRKW